MMYLFDLNFDSAAIAAVDVVVMREPLIMTAAVVLTQWANEVRECVLDDYEATKECDCDFHVVDCMDLW